MSNSQSPQPWHVPVSVAELPEEGQHVGLAADAGVRAAVARLAGLRALPRLEARFHMVPQGAGAVHVTGVVSATVGQNCVVTLEPIESEVEEEVDLVFRPMAAADMRGTIAAAPTDEAAEDRLELLDDGTIDLGAVATEFLILGLDPYPRKAGVMFEPPRVEEPTSSPFAALAALKKGKDGA